MRSMQCSMRCRRWGKTIPLSSRERVIDIGRLFQPADISNYHRKWFVPSQLGCSPPRRCSLPGSSGYAKAGVSLGNNCSALLKDIKLSLQPNEKIKLSHFTIRQPTADSFIIGR